MGGDVDCELNTKTKEYPGGTEKEISMGCNHDTIYIVIDFFGFFDIIVRVQLLQRRVIVAVLDQKIIEVSNAEKSGRLICTKFSKFSLPHRGRSIVDSIREIFCIGHHVWHRVHYFVHLHLHCSYYLQRDYRTRRCIIY